MYAYCMYAVHLWSNLGKTGHKYIVLIGGQLHELQ